MPAMSKIANTAAVLAAAFISQAAAHTYVKEFEAGGKTYPGFYAADKSGGDDSSPAWRTNQGWGFQPVMGDKINDADIIAHIDAEPSPFTAPVDAGSDVKFTWQHDGECGGEEVGWDCSHHGWTATWLAPCNGDCKDVQKENLSFFKIHQAGLMDYPAGTRYAQGGGNEDTGYWGTDAIFYDNANTQTVTIPKDLPSGNYVLRTEVASVHNNGAVSERQFWPQALNIAINNGNDNAKIPAGIKATEIYSSSDKQLTFDLYQHTAGETFDAPGPALAPCASGSGSGSDSGSGASSGSSSAAAEAPSATAAPMAPAQSYAAQPASDAEPEAPSATAAPAVPVESSHVAHPTPEVGPEAGTPASATHPVVYVTATQYASVTATGVAPAASSAAGYNTPAAPETTAAPGSEGEGEGEEDHDDEEGDDEEEGDEEEGDDEEGNDEEGSDEEDGGEDYSDDEEEGDYAEDEQSAGGQQEEASTGYHSWGAGKEHWRSHARDFV
jgi:cellulase